MADNNQQVEEPALNEATRKAQNEFNGILDVLLVPLRADVSDQKLPFRRRWRGGCLLKRPDLVPIPPDAQGFCGQDNTLRFIVENQGDADAPKSSARVTFRPGTPDGQPTQHDILIDEIIQAEAVSRPYSADIPQSCIGSGDCKFTITVDALNQVVEFDKANNTVSGKCSRGGVDLDDAVGRSAGSNQEEPNEAD